MPRRRFRPKEEAAASRSRRLPYERPLKWRRFEPSITFLCVRGYCRYQLSYRDLGEMMRERGLSVDHTTVRRRGQRFAPELNKLMRPHLKMSGASYPEALAASVREKVLPSDCEPRRAKYLNDFIEQDYRAARGRWRAAQCYRSFHTPERAVEGVESMYMLGKGQVKGLDGCDAMPPDRAGRRMSNILIVDD